MGASLWLRRLIGKHGGFLGRLFGFTALLSLVANGVPLISYVAVSLQNPERLTSLYPEDGIGLAILWRYGARFWPAVLVSSTLLSLRLGTPLLSATGVGWMDVLLDMTALWLLTRWRVQATLDRTSDVAGFTLAILMAAALALPIYSLRIWLLFGIAGPESTLFGLHYFLSAFFSYLIIAPLILVWKPGYIGYRRRVWLLVGSMLGIAVMGVVLFSVDSYLRERLLFLLLPFIVLASIAARVGGASAAAALIAIVMILLGEGSSTTLTNYILRTLFIATATLTGYLLAVVLAERGRAVAEIDYRASHDVLTGLINRFEFQARLQAALSDAERRYVLLYLDLDQFKLVNDTCGHLAGDRMLQMLGKSLSSVLPQGATLARLGGDEFGCLLPDCDQASADEVSRRFHETIRAFRFQAGARSFSVGVSIGGTVLSPGEDKTPEDVLSHADVACYAAKEAGRNRTSFYAHADVVMTRWLAELQELSQLRAALSGGLFQLYAQRIANIHDASDTRPFYELLLRHAPPNEERPIGEMLGMALRFGLVTEVDRWVFEHAAVFLREMAGRNLRLTVNCGATSLETEGFQQFVAGLPQRYGFGARQMCIEITESVAVQNLTRAVATLRALREQGFDIALDDFGAGVASFGYLSELPVTIVKLDGRFVQHLGTEPAARVIVESLVRIATFRGIPCIAECVEDSKVIPELRRLGVTYVQGFAIDRPAPIATLRSLLSPEPMGLG